MFSEALAGHMIGPRLEMTRVAVVATKFRLIAISGPTSGLAGVGTSTNRSLTRRGCDDIVWGRILWPRLAMSRRAKNLLTCPNNQQG